VWLWGADVHCRQQLHHSLLLALMQSRGLRMDGSAAQCCVCHACRPVNQPSCARHGTCGLCICWTTRQYTCSVLTRRLQLTPVACSHCRRPQDSIILTTKHRGHGGCLVGGGGYLIGGGCLRHCRSCRCHWACFLQVSWAALRFPSPEPSTNTLRLDSRADPARVLPAAQYSCFHPLRDVVTTPTDLRMAEWAARSRAMSVDDIISRKTKWVAAVNAHEQPGVRKCSGCSGAVAQWRSGAVAQWRSGVDDPPREGTRSEPMWRVPVSEWQVVQGKRWFVHGEVRS